MDKTKFLGVSQNIKTETTFHVPIRDSRKRRLPLEIRNDGIQHVPLLTKIYRKTLGELSVYGSNKDINRPVKPTKTTLYQPVFELETKTISDVVNNIKVYGGDNTAHSISKMFEINKENLNFKSRPTLINKELEQTSLKITAHETMSDQIDIKYICGECHQSFSSGEKMTSHFKSCKKIRWDVPLTIGFNNTQKSLHRVPEAVHYDQERFDNADKDINKRNVYSKDLTLVPYDTDSIRIIPEKRISESDPANEQQPNTAMDELYNVGGFAATEKVSTHESHNRSKLVNEDEIEPTSIANGLELTYSPRAINSINDWHLDSSLSKITKLLSRPVQVPRNDEMPVLVNESFPDNDNFLNQFDFIDTPPVLVPEPGYELSIEEPNSRFQSIDFNQIEAILTTFRNGQTPLDKNATSDEVPILVKESESDPKDEKNLPFSSESTVTDAFTDNIKECASTINQENAISVVPIRKMVNGVDNVNYEDKSLGAKIIVKTEKTKSNKEKETNNSNKEKVNIETNNSQAESTIEDAFIISYKPNELEKKVLRNLPVERFSKTFNEKYKPLSEYSDVLLPDRNDESKLANTQNETKVIGHSKDDQESETISNMEFYNEFNTKLYYQNEPTLKYSEEEVQNMNHKKQEFKCKKCLVIFSTPLCYVNHLIMNHYPNYEKQNFIKCPCSKWNKTYSLYKNNSLMHHLQSSHLYSETKCFSCKMEFLNFPELNKHIQECDSGKFNALENNLQCQLCWCLHVVVDIADVGTILEEIEQNEKNIDKMTENDQIYEEKYTEMPNTPESSTKLQYEKQPAGKVTKPQTRHEVAEDIKGRMWYDGKLFFCSLCHAQFDQYVCCKDHLLKVHSFHFTYPAGSEVFQCPICLAIFHNTHFLKKHLTEFHAVYKYQCNKCKSKFNCQEEYNHHQKYCAKKIMPNSYQRNSCLHCGIIHCCTVDNGEDESMKKDQLHRRGRAEDYRRKIDSMQEIKANDKNGMDNGEDESMKKDQLHRRGRAEDYRRKIDSMQEIKVTDKNGVDNGEDESMKKDQLHRSGRAEDYRRKIDFMQEIKATEKNGMDNATVKKNNSCITGFDRENFFCLTHNKEFKTYNCSSAHELYEHRNHENIHCLFCNMEFSHKQCLTKHYYENCSSAVLSLLPNLSSWI